MKRIIYFVSALLLFITYNANAQRIQGKGGQGGCNIYAVDQLNLTDAQKTKISELRYDHQNKAIELRADLQQTRLAIRKLNRSADINKDEYLSLVEKRNDIRDQISVMKAELHLEILNQLDAEQKKALTEYKTNNCFAGKNSMRNRNNSGRHGGHSGKNCRFN